MSSRRQLSDNSLIAFKHNFERMLFTQQDCVAFLAAYLRDHPGYADEVFSFIVPLSNRLLKKALINQAEKAIDAILAVAPENVFAIGQKVKIFHHRGIPLKALDWANERGNPHLNLRNARCYLALHLPSTALSYFEKVAERNGPINIMIALCYLEKGDADAALRYTDSLPEGNPKVHFLRAQAYLELNEPHNAEYEINCLRNLNERKEALLLEARLFCLKGEVRDAWLNYNNYQALSPTYTERTLFRAEMHVAEASFSKAFTTLTDANQRFVIVQTLEKLKILSDHGVGNDRTLVELLRRAKDLLPAERIAMLHPTKHKKDKAELTIELFIKSGYAENCAGQFADPRPAPLYLHRRRDTTAADLLRP